MNNNKTFSSVKKIAKYILLVLLVIIFLLTLRAFVAAFFMPQVIESSFGNRDTIAVLGDGKFELAKSNNHIVLQDERFGGGNLTIVNTVEDYSIKDDYLYVIGDYTSGYKITAEGTEMASRYLDMDSGEYIRYKESDSVPRYLILNTQTADLRAYSELEEIPEIDREIFIKMF
ncbi:MAG: hypothetical protein B6242_16905 [Anaerolineaceae bacterium 4572_78]|nr:MAG: hypothetical protein B6242_16905 [Anaerolineaceae bacterium 4572_78]